MKSLKQFITEAMIGVDNYEIICKEFATKADALSKDVCVTAETGEHSGPGGNELTFEVRATQDEFDSMKNEFKTAFEKMFRDSCKILKVPYKTLYDASGGYDMFFGNTWEDKGMVGTGCLLCSENDFDWRYDKKMTEKDMCVALAANCYAFFAVNDALRGTDLSGDAEKLCIGFVNNVKNAREKLLHR